MKSNTNIICGAIIVKTLTVEVIRIQYHHGLLLPSNLLAKVLNVCSYIHTHKHHYSIHKFGKDVITMTCMWRNNLIP